jgi:hypothetical protein
MAMVVNHATHDGLAIELERQDQCVGFIVGQFFEDCWPGAMWRAVRGDFFRGGNEAAD